MFELYRCALRPVFVRHLISTTLACAAVLTAPAAVAAEPFPQQKPVTLMVPYPAGGASDASARIFSKPISESLKQTVLVENVGGASGSIAANKVLAAPADGYYMFHGSPTELILAPLTNTAVRYKPEDFQLVHPITTGTMVLLTRGDLGVADMDGLIRLSRDRKHSPLSYGSVGVGSLYQLVVEFLAKQADMTVAHVPYRGAAPVIQDLAGGQIDFAVLPYQVSMQALNEQKRVKILATIGHAIPAPLAAIPKINDSTLLKNKDLSILKGLLAGYFVKKGTPEPVVTKLREAISFALQQKDLIASLELEGRVVATPMSAAEVAALQKAEIGNYRALVKFLDFKPF